MAAEVFRRPVAPGGSVAEFRRLVRLERFKLRRRPMPTILFAILCAIVFGNAWLFYLVLGGLGDGPAGVDSERILDRLVFPAVLDASVENGLSFGLPLLVILAAASFGGEFAWGTVRLLLARGAGRGAYVLSKLAAIWLWWGVALVAAVIASLVAGTMIAAVDGAPGPGSVAAGDWLTMIGRCLLAWLATGVYAALAAQFAVLYRSTAVGLALGLVTFFGEGIVGEAAASLGAPAFEVLMRAGIAYNLRSLLGTLEGKENPALMAAGFLAVYTILAVSVTIRHLRKHDVVVAGVG